MSMLNIKSQTQYALIDSLLDSYNENIALFQMFGDPCYKEKADYFIEMLKRHFSCEEEAEIVDF